MMLTLYYSPATAGMVVHWLLIELGAPHRLHKLDFEAREQKSPEYLKINPAGVVPALVLDDGMALCEAAAITMHLADSHPEAGFAPTPGTPERAQYYQWMFFMANTLQPAYRAWFYPSEPAGEANIEASKERAREVVETAWERVATHLSAKGPYLLGAKISAADFFMTMLMRWSRNMPKPAHTLPALGAHAQLMKARPAFKEVYAREGLTDWT
ncbi:MAG: glutathione S-transferase family protein [Polyangiaceae bacterium]